MPTRLTRLAPFLVMLALAGWDARTPVHAQAGVTVSTAGVPLPGRAGRLADFSGSVWIFERDQGEWLEALRNRPLTQGDRISTGQDARAEVRVGSTTLRIGARSELEVVQLDEQRLSLRLHSGGVALRLRTRDWAEQVDLVTDEVRLKPMQAGHYRADRVDDVTFAGSWRGEWLVDEAGAFPIGSGQRMEFWRDRGVRQQRAVAMPADALQAWVVSEDHREERTTFSTHVSPEMTGAEELERHGRWEQVAEHGTVWFPLQVQLGWAPYQFGRWVWVRPWGWTWIDNQPWGFAPFHYGRWVQWRGRWGWVPGGYTPRPIFAPMPRPPHLGPPHPPPRVIRPVHPTPHPPPPPHAQPPHPVHPSTPPGTVRPVHPGHGPGHGPGRTRPDGPPQAEPMPSTSQASPPPRHEPPPPSVRVPPPGRPVPAPREPMQPPAPGAVQGAGPATQTAPPRAGGRPDRDVKPGERDRPPRPDASEDSRKRGPDGRNQDKAAYR